MYNNTIVQLWGLCKEDNFLFFFFLENMIKKIQKACLVFFTEAASDLKFYN